MLSVNDSKTFQTSYRLCSESRWDKIVSSADTTIKQSLVRDGIAVAKGLLGSSDVASLMQFQSAVEAAMGTPTCSGYVSVGQAFLRSDGTIAISSAHNSELRPNHGQVRVQTKGMHFEMPGFRHVAQHETISSIFRWWSDDESIATRGTMEWIIPAALNHNGWHKDTVRPLLKAMIVLGKIDVDTAPMYYANGSHLCASDFEAEISRRMTINGTAKIDETVSRRGNHYPAIVGGHSGFVGDNFTVNDPSTIDDAPIRIGDKSYQKTVCTGDVGDVIFFDVSGFHSGNVSRGKIRRSISISSPSAQSDIGKALDAMGVHSS